MQLSGLRDKFNALSRQTRRRVVVLVLGIASALTFGIGAHLVIENNIERENARWPMTETQENEMRSRQWKQAFNIAVTIARTVGDIALQDSGGDMPSANDHQPYDREPAQSQPSDIQPAPTTAPQDHGSDTGETAQTAPQQPSAQEPASQGDNWRKYRCINDPAACAPARTAPRQPSAQNDNLPDAQDPDFTRKYRDTFGTAPQPAPAR